MKRRGFLGALVGVPAALALPARAEAAAVPLAAPADPDRYVGFAVEETYGTEPVNRVVPLLRQVNIPIEGDGMWSREQIRDHLIPALNEAIANGARLNT